jgi:hypothetical protein
MLIWPSVAQSYKHLILLSCVSVCMAYKMGFPFDNPFHPYDTAFTMLGIFLQC